VPLVLHENQRLDAKLSTRAMGGPKFTATGLGHRGRRPPFELRMPSGSFDGAEADVPAWRSDVQLPLLEDPFQLPPPKSAVREGSERSHFWL